MKRIFSEKCDLGRLFVIVLLLALSTTCFVSITFASSPRQTQYQWSDPLQYTGASDFQQAGWEIVGPANLVSFPGNGVQLDNDGSSTVTIAHSDFPTSIYNWNVGVEGIWIGRQYGSIQIGVQTTTHTYIWGGDGFYSEYALYRDGVKVLRFGDYAPHMKMTYDFAIEKNGNSILLYFNNTVINTYNETDPSGELEGIYLPSGFLSTVLYDNVAIAAVAGSTQTAPALSASQRLITITAAETATAMGFTSTFVQVINVIQSPPGDIWSSITTIIGVIASISGIIVAVIVVYEHARGRKEKKKQSRTKRRSRAS